MVATIQAVLVSVPDLECGFSRDLFVQWASNPRNSIILTSRPATGCLARELIDNLKMKSIELEVCQCAPTMSEIYMWVCIGIYTSVYVISCGVIESGGNLKQTLYICMCM